MTKPKYHKVTLHDETNFIYYMDSFPWLKEKTFQNLQSTMTEKLVACTFSQDALPVVVKITE